MMTDAATPKQARLNDGLGGFSRCSKFMRIDNETRVLCDLFVQRTPSLICCLGCPINATTLCGTGCCVDRLDQKTAYTTPAILLRHKKILQVAYVVKTRSAAMEQVVRGVS